MSRILLTGATGMIGGSVLHQALSRTDQTWLCLVRAADEDAGRERIVRRLERFTDPENARVLAARAEIIVGDFTKAPSLTDPRLDDVTQILHLAADTSWWAEQKVHATNHDGTLALAERARRMPKLERFLHVSTAMICGGKPPRVVPETMYPSAEASHLVHYSASKARAESSLAELYSDLPIVIARPSIVIGHTELGSRPGASILWVVRAGDRLRLVAGNVEARIDIVPADWVASTLIEMLKRPTLKHRVYHLSGGHQSASRWSEIERAFEAADPTGGLRKYENFDSANSTLLRRRFKETFGLDSAVKIAMYRGLKAYYQFCELDVLFENDRLLEEGFAAPTPLSGYLATCLSSDEDIVTQFHEDFANFAQAATKPANSQEPLRASA